MSVIITILALLKQQCRRPEKLNAFVNNKISARVGYKLRLTSPLVELQYFQCHLHNDLTLLLLLLAEIQSMGAGKIQGLAPHLLC